MWNAVDVVCFSSLTHAATLLTLRSYFRRNWILATIRVVVMYTIYFMLLVAIVFILKPHLMDNDRPKLSESMTRFWHGAGYIEIFGILLIYLITYLPIFLSKEAMKVRICIAMNPGQLTFALNQWKPYRRQGGWFHKYRLRNWFNLYKAIRSLLTKLAIVFCKHYIMASPWTGRLLWIISEVLSPFRLTPVFLLIMWVFGLGFMCMKIAQQNDATDWSFGQLLPVFLVFLPFHTFIGSIAGECL
jgi:hypothetical protein